MAKGRIGILTGGGDTCALNRSIEIIKNMAHLIGYQIYGIHSGWQGLTGDGDMIDITNVTINGDIGGSILNSSRTNPFKKDHQGNNRVDEVLRNIRRYGLDVIVAIGGDDTLGAAKRLYDHHKIPVVGFPKTIDNDLRTKTIHEYKGQSIETVLCPGFPTAAEKIAQLIREIRTTARTHRRIFVVEVMGRNAGWLPAAAAHGMADMILLPEVEMTHERVEDFFEKVNQTYQKKGNLVIAASEGVKWHNPQSDQCETIKANMDLDEYGHPRLGGIASHIASEITARKINKEARSQTTGYIPRSGLVSHYDRQLSTALGHMVMKMLHDGEYGRLPVMKSILDFKALEAFNVKTIDIGEIENKPLPLETYYDIGRYHVTPAYDDFLYQILGKKYELPNLTDRKPIRLES